MSFSDILKYKHWEMVMEFRKARIYEITKKMEEQWNLVRLNIFFEFEKTFLNENLKPKIPFSLEDNFC